MSQLRNLLTNKVAKYQHGSRKAYRRSLRYIRPGVANAQPIQNQQTKGA